MEINHRSDVVKLTFRALALSSEQRRLWKIIKTVISSWIIFILLLSLVPQRVYTKRFKETSLLDLFLYPPSCLCLSFVNVVLLNIPSHSRVCHFTSFSFTNQHITSCQVSVDNLKRKVTSDISLRENHVYSNILMWIKIHAYLHLHVIKKCIPKRKSYKVLRELPSLIL